MKKRVLHRELRAINHEWNEAVLEASDEMDALHTVLAEVNNAKQLKTINGTSQQMANPVQEENNNQKK